MADGTVKMEFTADEAKMVLAIKNVLRHQRRMTGEAKRTARETRRAARAGRSFTSSLSTLSAITGGVVGIGLAWRTINEEIQRALDRTKEIAEITRTRAGELLPAVTALPPQIRARGPEFLDRLVREAQEAGPIAQVEILKSVQRAASLASKITAEGLLETVKLGARLSVTTTEMDAPMFSGGIISIGKLADLEKHPRAAAGLLFQLGTAMPIPEIAMQAKNIPEAISAILPLEPSMEDAGEFLAAFAQFTGDVTGKRSGTRGGAIAARIRKEGLFPTGRGGELEPLSAEDRKDRSTLELLELVRGRLEKETADVGEQERFIRFEQVISTISESVKGASFVRAVLNRDPRALAEIEHARRAIGPVETPAEIAAAEAFFEKTVREVEERPDVKALIARRRVEAGLEQLALAQPIAAIKGDVIAALEQFEKISPEGSALSLKIGRLRALADRDPGVTIDRFQELVQEQIDPMPALPPRMRLGPFGGPVPRREERPRDPDTVGANRTILAGLIEMKALYEDIKEINKQQLEAMQATEQNTKRTADGNGRVTPLPTGGFDTEQ